MKKLLSMIIAMLLLCTILETAFLPTASATIIAGAKTSGDWEYTISGDEATIVYYNGNFKKSVEIPSKLGGKKVTSIAWGAFSCLPVLQSITIPDSVVTISDEAFLNSTSLQKVTIGKGAKNIEGNPFDGCTNLRTIAIASNHEYLQLIDGVLFTKDPMRLICYPAGKTESSYALPDGVIEIGDSAFSGNTKLKTLIIPSSVTKINSTAFNNGYGEKQSITLDVTDNEYAKAYAIDKQMKYIEENPPKDTAFSTADITAFQQVPTRDNQYLLYDGHRFGEKMAVKQLNLSLSFLGFENASLCLNGGNDGLLHLAGYYFPSRSSEAKGREDYELVETQLAQLYGDLSLTDNHGAIIQSMLAFSVFANGGEIASQRRVDTEYGIGIDHMLMKWNDEYRHMVLFEVYNMESFQEKASVVEAKAEAPTATSAPTAIPAPTEALKEDNKVIYQNGWTTITFSEFSYNPKNDRLTLHAIVENSSDNNATFEMEKAVCNGWAVDDFCLVDVPANSKARAEFKFDDFGKSTGISDVAEIESFRFYIQIFDSSTYKNLQETTGPFEIDPFLFSKNDDQSKSMASLETVPDVMPPSTIKADSFLRNGIQFGDSIDSVKAKETLSLPEYNKLDDCVAGIKNFVPRTTVL